MSEMHTNTTADTDKYILNGVEVTPNEFIDIVTNFLEAQQSRLRIRDARITKLKAVINQLIEVSEKMFTAVIAAADSYDEGMRVWDKIVNDWKEG